MFNFVDSNGEGKMNYPKGLAIYGNRILISQGFFQSSSCILNYQLDGKFISKIGKGGKGELEFNYPCGLTIDESNVTAPVSQPKPADPTYYTPMDPVGTQESVANPYYSSLK